MGPDGKDRAFEGLRLELATESSDARESASVPDPGNLEVVFDFTGLHRPGLCDLALILTARLQADPGERVWVRALPDATWNLLRGLGLDHMFHVLPGPGKIRN